MDHCPWTTSYVRHATNTSCVAKWRSSGQHALHFCATIVQLWHCLATTNFGVFKTSSGYDGSTQRNDLQGEATWIQTLQMRLPQNCIVRSRLQYGATDQDLDMLIGWLSVACPDRRNAGKKEVVKVLEKVLPKWFRMVFSERFHILTKGNPWSDHFILE